MSLSEPLIDNLIIDIQTLATAAGGDENTTVYPRDGNSYPSAHMAVHLISQVGLGFSPYPDLATLTVAGASADTGSFAVVFDDPAIDTGLDDLNGLYRKGVDGWALVRWDMNARQKAYLDKAKYDAIAVAAKDAATTLVNKNEVNAGLLAQSNHLLVLTDASDQSYLIVDAYGGLILSGMEGSVQSNINRLTSVSDTNYSNDNLLDIVDADGNVVVQFTGSDINILALPDGVAKAISDIDARINYADNDDFIIYGYNDIALASFTADGDLLLNQVPGGVGSVINGSFLGKTQKESTNYALYDLHDKALSKVTTLQMQTGLRAPIPLECVPLSFSPPASILAETITQPDRWVPIDTPYRNDDGVVHPAVIQFADTFNHKKFWLGITPYYTNNNKYENPVVMGSDDLVDFKMFTDYPQPLSENPSAKPDYKGAYNSDVFYFYDFNTGDLCCGWRLTEDLLITGREVSLLYRRTKDGINWSSAEVLLPKQGGIALSPSVLYDFDAKKYYLYVIAGVDGAYALVRHETNRIGGAWSNATVCTGLTSTGAVLWHADARYLGDKIAVLIQDNTGTQNLYLGLSSDGLAFTMSGGLVTGEYSALYKATFTFVTNDAGQMSLIYIWTSNQSDTDPNKRWRLYVNKTNPVSVA